MQHEHWRIRSEDGTFSVDRKKKAPVGQLSRLSKRLEEKMHPFGNRIVGPLMKLLEQLANRTSALKVNEVAEMFGVTPQHIYKMAASGQLPSFRVAGAVRFDPQDLAYWLMKKSPSSVPVERFRKAESAL